MIAFTHLRNWVHEQPVLGMRGPPISHVLGLMGFIMVFTACANSLTPTPTIEPISMLSEAEARALLRDYLRDERMHIEAMPLGSSDIADAVRSRDVRIAKRWEDTQWRGERNDEGYWTFRGEALDEKRTYRVFEQTLVIDRDQ